MEQYYRPHKKYNNLTTRDGSLVRNTMYYPGVTNNLAWMYVRTGTGLKYMPCMAKA